MTPSDAAAQRLGVALAVLAALGFSFKAIFVKLAYAVPQSVPVDAVTLLALRMALSVPVFAWVGWRASRGASPLRGRDWAALAVLGLLGYYGASILDFMGLRHISAALERLILFTYPTMTLLLTALFLQRPVARHEWVALGLTYAGIGLAFAHDLRWAGDGGAVWLGAGLVLGSAVSYALYQAGSEPVIRRLGAARFTALAMLVSTVATLVHFAASQPLAALITQAPPVYGYALAMALLSTVAPVFMGSAAIARIGAARAVLIGTLGPVFTIFLGWLLLDESLSLAQLLGAALVLAGVWRVGRR